jgi:hypothetical protein
MLFVLSGASLHDAPDGSARGGARKHLAVSCPAAVVIVAEAAYRNRIDLWPDNRAVSLSALPSARSDSLSKHRQPSAGVQSHAFAHVHLRHFRKVPR